MHLIIQSEFQPNLNKLHPNEYSKEFHCYSFSVKLDRCTGSCNTLNGLSNKVCVPNKTVDLNQINYRNKWIEIINKAYIVECKCKFDGRNCNSDQWWNNDKCWCECKNTMYVKKIMSGILLHVIVKMKNI